MDLQAYMISEDEMIMSYVNKHYGEIPRLRGVRFMKLEVPCGDGVFDSYCGKDVIYIHTRCGGDNYECFEADVWENNNPLFLEGVDVDFDCTYRDHYFEAVVDDEYNSIINQ